MTGIMAHIPHSDKKNVSGSTCSQNYAPHPGVGCGARHRGKGTNPRCKRFVENSAKLPALRCQRCRSAFVRDRYSSLPAVLGRESCYHTSKAGPSRRTGMPQPSQQGDGYSDRLVGIQSRTRLPDLKEETDQKSPAFLRMTSRFFKERPCVLGSGLPKPSPRYSMLLHETDSITESV